ncbi:hypothetical protein OPQ81_007369 [Rhizoctonia solani]|nr:hypothetical protein OPQ81_007369 [Rhizoctonia solani]
MNTLRVPARRQKLVPDDQPSTHALRRLPGASTYRVANNIITAKRKAMKLQDPFVITFENWGPGNAVYDWYRGLQNPYIQVMHLRKERNGPFYHEFVVFRLRDGTFWRIDRRQLPDEPVPVNSIMPEGVPAYDTVEQVTGMESFLDPLLASGSDCMVELEFKKDVDVGLVLRICRAIKTDKCSSVYTLQRYNCFFFAQTLIMCTACGASDWAGWGGPREGVSHQNGPWKSPNVPLDEKGTELNNAAHLRAFNWNPSDNLNHEWGTLSEQPNELVRASPLLRHADHCNYCLESQSKHRQRSLSSEIRRLEGELVAYWNKEYQQLLNDTYRINHENFIKSGVWEIIKENNAEKNCKAALPPKLEMIRGRWDKYSEKRLEDLLGTVKDLLDPEEVCDAWYPDPDEWRSTWTCKDGGPVKAAMQNWEEDVKNFIKQEFENLKVALEAQTIESSTQVHADAMRRRMESFKEAMTIKIRDMDEEELIKPITPEEAELPDGTNPPQRALSPDGMPKPDNRSVFSGKTRKSVGTFFSSSMSRMTKRGILLRNRMQRFSRKSHKLEEADVIRMERRIRFFITRHGNNVEFYKPWLKCTSQEVQEDIMKRMNDVWECVIR